MTEVYEARCVNEHCAAAQVWVLLRPDGDDETCTTCGRPLANQQQVPWLRYVDPDAEFEVEPDEGEGP